MNNDEVYERWKTIGLLDVFNDDEIKKKNAAELYEKMALYLLNKKEHITKSFENAAFAIICKVIVLDGVWNGPFIPREIEETYNSFCNSDNPDFYNEAEACLKTAEHYATNKKINKNKPKNGGIFSIR